MLPNTEDITCLVISSGTLYHQAGNTVTISAGNYNRVDIHGSEPCCEAPNDSLLTITSDRKTKEITELSSQSDRVISLVVYDKEDLKRSVCIHQRMRATTEESSDKILTMVKSHWRSRAGERGQLCEAFTAPMSTKICLWKRRLCSFYRFPELMERHSAVARALLRQKVDVGDVVSRSDWDCDCGHSLRQTISMVQDVWNWILGILMLIILAYYGQWISAAVNRNTEAVIRSTLSTLDWLMGAPAGLKLNNRLSAFLGKFFTYHVWLWAEYLKLCGRHSQDVLYLIGCFGLVGGLRLQLTITQDLVSVLSLHLYCFYLYSARLYAFFLHSIGSLWRLFRGKKWNALRHRVDHFSYDITQLFLGTLFFSILLFLLPTVALYYAVFGLTGLELLHHAVRYDYILLRLLILTNSRLTKDNYSIEVYPASHDNLTLMNLQYIKSASYRGCCKLLRLPSHKQPLNFSATVRNLLIGELC